MKIKTMVTKFSLAGFLLLASACVEKPVKLVIDPPVQGGGGNEDQNLTYETQDRLTGKSEKVTIPVPQMPQRLVVDQSFKKPGDQIPSATLADNNFADATTPDDKDNPKISYLKGIESVENLYRGEKYHDALINLAPLIEAYPKQPKLYTMQGTIYRKLGETKMAYKAYSKALTLDKDNLKIQEVVDNLQAQAGEVSK
jgi:tetratricopeptide (TPR) repeat protein